MVPFWVPIIIRGLVLGDPKRDHNFDNPPHRNPSPNPKLYFLGAWTLRELPAGLAPEFEGWLQQGPRPVEWGLGF